MKINTVKRLFDEGKPTVGGWLSLNSPLSAEYMAHIGFDWLVVDAEHSPVNLETMLHCFQAICTTPTIPMARVPWNDQTMIKQILDTGAMGIVVPMVNSGEEAARAGASALYPPDGVRGMAGARCTVYGDDYHARANDEIIVMVQIEHIDAVERTEEILSAKGVTGGFVGPRDLACSMDIEMGVPEHEAAIQHVLKTAKAMGKPMGIMTGSGAEARKRVLDGFQFVAAGGDALYVKVGGKKILDDAHGR